MVPTTLLTTLLLTFAVAAKPMIRAESFVKLPITRRVNSATGSNIVRQDQQRAETLKAKGDAISNGDIEALQSLAVSNAISSPVENQVGSYSASVGVGSPATQYQLIVDTGSSTTWVGAGTPYKQTSTSSKTNQSVHDSYGSGSFSGTEYIDQVTFGPGPVIPRQSIGVASTSSGFPSGIDGLLGIGPVGLTVGKLSPDTNIEIPTVTDNLFSDGTIPAHEIGISFEPISSSTGDQVNGEITWGGTDSSKINGSITFTPITSTSPASVYWGIDQATTYGEFGTPILDLTAGIVDTGTTLVLLATDAFQRYQTATGGVLDEHTGLLTITSEQFSKLESLFFTVNNAQFELTANAQIWPRALNSEIGGVSGNIYLIVGDTGSPSGEGFDFTLGMTFLERFYSVFDTANQQVGLAYTPFTSANTN